MGESRNIAEERSAKQKLVHELRQLVAIFLYLAVFFTVFRLYTHLVLAEYQINYVAYGLVLLKSLVLAKVILTGEALRLGEWTRARPLIILTVYYAALFSVFALVMEILEHLALGWLHGKTSAAALAEITAKGWPHFMGMTMLVFVAFIPFFAFREASRVLGEGKLEQLFFKKVGQTDFGATETLRSDSVKAG